MSKTTKNTQPQQGVRKPRSGLRRYKVEQVLRRESEPVGVGRVALSGALRRMTKSLGNVTQKRAWDICPTIPQLSCALTSPKPAPILVASTLRLPIYI
jgi:hypothetical protein